jgi:hypothetical protein
MRIRLLNLHTNTFQAGYLEGIEAGKQQGLEEGFHHGFVRGLQHTIHWAVLRGKIRLGYAKLNSILTIAFFIMYIKYAIYNNYTVLCRHTAQNLQTSEVLIIAKSAFSSVNCWRW